jgi:hypothetical protein
VDGFHFTWKQAKGIGGINFTPQRSIDLTNWYPASGTPVKVGEDAFTETWQVVEPAPLPDYLFLRLSVTELPQ